MTAPAAMRAKMVKVVKVMATKEATRVTRVAKMAKIVETTANSKYMSIFASTMSATAIPAKTKNRLNWLNSVSIVPSK